MPAENRIEWQKHLRITFKMYTIFQRVGNFSHFAKKIENLYKNINWVDPAQYGTISDDSASQLACSHLRNG